MEKILCKEIKKVELKKEPLTVLNSFIEENFVNSQVVFVVDFLTYQKEYLLLEELKKCSLNNVIIKVLYSTKKTENELTKMIDETYSLVVGIGEIFALKFVKNFAIKNNINYAFVCLNSPKCEIFSNFYEEFDNFNNITPTFVLIEEIFITNKIMLDLSLNIYKYSYILLEEKYENVHNDYLKIITDINRENILAKLVEFGLILNRNKINFFINEKDDFKGFINSQILTYTYKNLFLNINRNNLIKINSLIFNNKNQIFEYEHFSVKFNRFMLLINKNYYIDKINDVININKVLLQNLKTIDIFSFYLYCKNYNFYYKKKQNINVPFLDKMKYFKIFNNAYKIFA